MKNLKKLSVVEFDATFIPPMTFMQVGDETSKVDLKLFLETVIETENLKKSIADMSIDSVYQNANKTYEHVLINYGVKNMFLVAVIELKDKAIIGYHILDLNKQSESNN